jgi:hypothetical protein
MRSNVWQYAIVVLGVVVIVGTPELARPADPDWKAVEQALGKSGQMQPGDVFRLGVPRTDLAVTVKGVPVKAGFALGSYAGFKQVGDAAMVMGDLVLSFRFPRRSPCRALSFFDDRGSGAFDEREDFAPFPFGDPKLVQGRPQVAEEDLPIPRADPHPFVGSRHIPTGIVQGTSRTRAEKIDQQLLLPTDAVRCPVRPKAAQLRIRHQAGKEVISNRRNRIVTAETSI